MKKVAVALAALLVPMCLQAEIFTVSSGDAGEILPTIINPYAGWGAPCGDTFVGQKPDGSVSSPGLVLSYTRTFTIPDDVDIKKSTFDISYKADDAISFTVNGNAAASCGFTCFYLNSDFCFSQSIPSRYFTNGTNSLGITISDDPTYGVFIMGSYRLTMNLQRSITPTVAPTPTVIPTSTETPINTPTGTLTPSLTNTFSNTATDTLTPTPTFTPSPCQVSPWQESGSLKAALPPEIFSAVKSAVEMIPGGNEIKIKPEVTGVRVRVRNCCGVNGSVENGESLTDAAVSLKLEANGPIPELGYRTKEEFDLGAETISFEIELGAFWKVSDTVSGSFGSRSNACENVSCNFGGVSMNFSPGADLRAKLKGCNSSLKGGCQEASASAGMQINENVAIGYNLRDCGSGLDITGAIGQIVADVNLSVLGIGLNLSYTLWPGFTF